ncbi:MAG: Asparaginyl-tRNA synthetase, class IIb [Fibrobacteres bacterium]|nr:Asparaginyl-tRNA synthetase, class IIb [Fibrobacterota bacterium]
MSDSPLKRKVRDVLVSPKIGDDVQVQGWVRTKRESKAGLTFLEVNDGSYFQNLQVVVPADLPNYTTEIPKLYPGSSVTVIGKEVQSQGGKQAVEVQAREVSLLGACDPSVYPIGKQKMTYEYLRDFTHLRSRTNTFSAIARVRNVLSMAIHGFFQERGFLWLHTPIITANDAEGAGQMFRVTTLDMEKPPRKEDGGVDFAKDFFGGGVNLTVSGQLEAEAYACSMGNVYTFGPTFRAENSHTSRHLAEFWMVEPEMAFADLEDDARLAEDFLKHLLRNVLEKCPLEMEFFKQRVEPTILETLHSVVDNPFKRLTYTEAVEVLKKSGETFKYAVEWGIDLQSEHERYLTEKVFKAPVILTDYPKGIKAFYMKLNPDGKTVRAMDVLVPGIGEIIGGAQREDREDVLVSRIKEMGMHEGPLWWYLDLRRFGSVPHAGFGLGFERLVQFVTGMGNIRDVIPFPRTPGNIHI